MAVNNGLSHITSEDHMACMLQYNARALAYRLEELSSTLAEESKSTLAELVGFPGVRNVFAEKGTPGGTLSYINFFSIQTDIKPPQSTPRLLNAVGVSSPAVALWTCELCNRIMQENSKLDHLVGKAHAKKLMSESLTSKTPVMPANKASRRTNTKLDSFVEPPLRNWTCPACNFVFAIQEKTHHRCSSSESKPSTIDGPLDKFFRSYPSFRYDPSKPPAISFARLQNHLQQRHGWAHRGPETDELWHRYQAVLTQEFNLWFGVEDDLDAWHSLCRALRITSLPTTCELCRLAVRGRHVNIIDLIEWGRSGGKYVQIFPTVKGLSDYSFESGKIFSKEAVDELEAGAVLKHLLRPLAAAMRWSNPELTCSEPPGSLQD